MLLLLALSCAAHTGTTEPPSDSPAAAPSAAEPPAAAPPALDVPVHTWPVAGRDMPAVDAALAAVDAHAWTTWRGSLRWRSRELDGACVVTEVALVVEMSVTLPQAADPERLGEPWAETRGRLVAHEAAHVALYRQGQARAAELEGAPCEALRQRWAGILAELDARHGAFDRCVHGGGSEAACLLDEQAPAPAAEQP